MLPVKYLPVRFPADREIRFHTLAVDVNDLFIPELYAVFIENLTDYEFRLGPDFKPAGSGVDLLLRLVVRLKIFRQRPFTGLPARIFQLRHRDDNVLPVNPRVFFLH